MKRLLVLMLLAAGCYDASHDNAVEALGPETPGIPEGPTHRAGQPCTTCHTEDGPGESVFSFGGTIYVVKGGKVPLVGRVKVTDATGDSRTVQSNQIGNFWMRKSEWNPIFPLSAEIEAEGITRKMMTQMGRDGGCATCHREGGSKSYVPAVFLKETP